MLIVLEPVGLLGKRSAGDDFSLLRSSGGPISSRVESAASAWLQVYLDTRNPLVLAFHLLEGEPWLFRVQGEQATDAAGRPRALVVFGRLAEMPRADFVPQLLVAYSRLPVALSGDLPARVAVEQPPVSALNYAVAEGVLQLAIGFPTAVVEPLEEAAAILACYGLQRVNWVALTPRDRPPRFPAGPGLVISSDRMTAPQEIVRCVHEHGCESPLTLPLGDLARLSVTPQMRLSLVQAALGEHPPSLSVADVSWESLAWLAGIASARQAALRLLRREHVTRWLDSAFAQPEDLAALRPWLAEEHRSAVRSLVRRGPHPFDEYSDLFPNDVQGLVDMLPEAEARTWRELTGAPPRLGSAADGDELFQRLEGTRLTDLLPLESLAVAASRGGPLCCRVFGSRLVSEGLPESLAQSLVSGAPLVGSPEGCPRLEPSISWLQGINARGWLGLAERLTAVEPWHRWWWRGVAILLETERVSRQEVFEFGVKRREPRLLQAAGVPQPLSALAIPSAGLIRLPLQSCKVDEWTAAWLETQVADGTFFARLEPPLSDEAWDWIERSLREETVLNLVRQARTLIAHGSAVPFPWLSWLARLFSRHRLLEQIVAWAQHPLGPRRKRALELLLQQPLLKADERAWLRARTLECTPLAPSPDWSAEDLLTLLPLLDPLRDVVRVILERPRRGTGEDELLQRLIEELRRHPIAPLCTASPQAWEWRPDWLLALETLPGWEGFSSRDPGSLLLDVAARCRRLVELESGQLPDHVRVAVEQLAQEESRC